jgi:hypothetical protein
MDLGGAPTSTPLLAQVERGREVRRRLHGRLCRLGVMLRFLTFLNAVALLGATAFSLYAFGLAEVTNTALTIEWRVRAGAEYALMASAGVVLLALEHSATTNEAQARSSLGLAFSGAGRFWLLLFLALISLPAVHSQRSYFEFCATGGAVGALVVSALLQAWMLSCAPEYRAHVVAEARCRGIELANPLSRIELAKPLSRNRTREPPVAKSGALALAANLPCSIRSSTRQRSRWTRRASRRSTSETRAPTCTWVCCSLALPAGRHARWPQTARP